MGHSVFRTTSGEEAELEFGDVIGVDRGLFEHYGIYCGNSEVIHYTIIPENPWALRIYRTDMSHFLIRNRTLFVLDCTDPWRPEKSAPIPMRPRWYRDFHLYSPEETVKRAESQIGRGRFNLLVNNCEHFAIWCKTGLHKSYQIEQVLKVVEKVWYRV